MKLLKYGYSLLLVMGLLTACSSSHHGSAATGSINGNWILQTINVEGITEKFEPKIFNEADLNCFIGSSWGFVSKDSTGSYSIVGGTKGCSTLQRNIHWSLSGLKDNREFQFNRLDEKNNSIDDSNGFRLSVTALSSTTLQLKSAITFEGKPGNIVYNFVKK